MKKSLGKDRFIVFTILSILISFQFSLYLLNPNSDFVWIFTLFIWGVGFFCSIRNMPMLILLVFMFSYFYVPFYNFFDGKIISGYSLYFHDKYIVNYISLINSCFLFPLVVFLSYSNDKNIISISRWTKDNALIFYFVLILITLLVLFGASGQTILEGGYGQVESQKSPLYEYVAVLFILAFAFHNGNKMQKTFLFLLLLFYILKSLLSGSRLETIQLGVLIFFYYFNFGRNISRVKLFALFGSGVFLLKFLGEIRGDPIGFLSSISSFSELLRFIFKGNNSEYLMSNSGDVYYSSMRLIGMIDSNILLLDDRLKSFLSFVFNLPLSFSEYKQYSNLAVYKKDIYPSGGGALFPVYFYVWLGFPGVIISGTLLAFLLKSFFSGGGAFIRVYVLSLFITFPRWFPYSPIGFVKISLIVSLLYMILLYVSKISRDKIFSRGQC